MEMIALIESKQSEISSAKSSSTLKIEELPTVEEVIAEFRRLKRGKSATPARGNLRDRNNFFLKLPEPSQKKAKEFLIQDHSNPVEAEHIVDGAMGALNLKYEVNRYPRNRAVFTLVDSTYDCTITASYDELFSNVIDYLKTMLNMKNVNGALSDVTNKAL